MIIHRPALDSSRKCDEFLSNHFTVHRTNSHQSMWRRNSKCYFCWEKSRPHPFQSQHASCVNNISSSSLDSPPRRFTTAASPRYQSNFHNHKALAFVSSSFANVSNCALLIITLHIFLWVNLWLKNSNKQTYSPAMAKAKTKTLEWHQFNNIKRMNKKKKKKWNEHHNRDEEQPRNTKWARYAE